MKRLLLKQAFAILIPLCLFFFNATAQKSSGKELTKQESAQWYKNQSWLNGLKLQPHPSVNQLEFAKQYQKNKVLWDKAFSYLKETDLENIATGKYPLIGDSLFASITRYAAKPLDSIKWEAHKKYIDIQYIIKGKEKIGVAPVAGAAITQPYIEKKDVSNFTTTQGKFYVAEPGTFFIFFPQDAHRPNVKTDGADSVKKIVIKVRVAE